ncbi:MAG TPA: hypothetical protein VFV37_04740 [Luteibaculaceae bacterium]|nr:hypothetical protein [Luteibaculaceae bacterium]
MKPSTELFQLVKSLTKSEKRFFKLTSSLQSGEKNYIKIFDAIEKQTDYNEDEIKSLFSDETFIKHFPSEKNHLYKLILKSLRAYHADNSAASILKQEIKNIEVLFKKALFKECGKFLQRAKKIASDNEKFYYSIDLIDWEKILLEEAYEAGEFTRELDELIAEEQWVIQCLNNLAEYQVLYSKINYIFRLGGFVKSDEEAAMVEEIAKNPLIMDSSLALSIRAKSICYYVRGFCCVAFRDIEGAIKNFEKAKEILESNQNILNDLPNRYVRIINNLAQMYISNKDYNKVEELLELFDYLSSRPAFTSADVANLIVFSKHTTRLLYYNRQGLYAEGVKQAEKTIKDFKDADIQLSKEKEIIFNYIVSYLYFGNAMYKDSLQWINKVLNDNENTLRQDIYSYARIFNLIIHFELGNYDLLEYIIKSTNRYLNKKNRDYAVETTLVDYIKKLSKQQNSEERKKLFGELNIDLENIFNSPSDRVILEYIDFRSWIFSKTEEKSFAEIVQQRGLPRRASAS